MHSTFQKINEKLYLDNWQSADSYTRQMFAWLPDIRNKLGKTFCLFNVVWPADSFIDTVPTDVDTYILHFGAEYTDWQWLNKFCKKFNHSRVILVSPYKDLLFAEPNLTLIQFNFWPQVLKWYQEEVPVTDIALGIKTKKISSLANRISQFRAYVCAHLYKTLHPSEYVMSWQGVLGKQEDLYLLNYTGNHKIDQLIDYIKSTFFDLKICPTEIFVNNPLNNLSYNLSLIHI